MNKLTAKAIALTLILSSLPMVASQTPQADTHQTKASANQESPSIWQSFLQRSPLEKAAGFFGTSILLWQVSKIAAPLTKAAFKIAPIALAIGATVLGISSFVREEDDFCNVGNAVMGALNGGISGLWNWGKSLLFGQDGGQDGLEEEEEEASV